MSRLEELRAEIAVLEAEEAFRVLKADREAGLVDEDLFELASAELRERRRVHREARALRPPDEGEVRPETIAMVAK